MATSFKILCSLVSFLALSASISSSVAATVIISDGQTLVSSGAGVFELGFFSPSGSDARYVGIWYKAIPVRTVVWVANRDAPLTGYSGVLNLTATGNLAIYDNNNNKPMWSTRLTSGLASPVVRLLDSGNLILTSTSNKVIGWQSFDYPTDTLLPGMKIGRDRRANREIRLTSWKSASDPSPGPYSVGVSVHVAPEIYTWNGSVPVDRSGPWDGYSWGGSAPFRSRDLVSHNMVSIQDGIYYSFDMTNKSRISILVLDPTGETRRLVLAGEEWTVYWFGPTDPCDRFGHCGANGLCNSGASPICGCLAGFVQPKSEENGMWNPTDGSDGCDRRAALSCRNGDGFRKVTGVRVPELSNAAGDGGAGGLDVEGCRDACRSNCSCTAFAFLGGSGQCITWFGRLTDVRALSEGTGEDLYVRVPASEADVADAETGNRTPFGAIVIATVSVISVFIFIIIISSLWIRRCRKRGIKFSECIATNIGESDQETGMKFLRYRFSTIVRATNNFSEEAKLGEGGFGPVYKGRLLEGQEVAVKRLAAYSGQGLEEFDNEILLIAKLQHRNLVRLLGCCIKDEEKMLIYEYMPNKSLDLYIFDPTRRAQLNWHTRFHIIEGIAQGLLYLHKYSRLRIIHRDLKASNILLDDDMNPKISDFGIAKIFGSNETYEKTRRVVGTYGYMAPEYAAEGLFSIKSDVFSFGVILLEIISGKKNSFIYDHKREKSQNLLGYSWSLWKEGKWGELVDPLMLEEGCDMIVVRRCIHVGLMCVQESFVDRPTMSDAITMLLSCESTSLPDPKEPAYFNLRVTPRVDSPSTVVSENCSLNEVTITVIESR